MRGFRSKLDAGAPLNLAVETEKAQALLQTFSTASLFASAALGAFCFLADHVLAFPFVQHHAWIRAALDNSVHGAVGLWSWAIVIGLRKKSDFYEVALAGFLASVIDLDHFYLAGSLSLKMGQYLPDGAGQVPSAVPGSPEMAQPAARCHTLLLPVHQHRRHSVVGYWDGWQQRLHTISWANLPDLVHRHAYVQFILLLPPEVSLSIKFHWSCNHITVTGGTVDYKATQIPAPLFYVYGYCVIAIV